MANILNFLNRNDGELQIQVIRSGFWVGSSSVVIWLLNVIRSIIVARLLVPEVFGLMAICSIAIDSMDVLTQTGFDAALIHRQNNIEEAIDTTFTLSVIRGFILFAIAYCLAPLIMKFYNREELVLAIRILALGFIIRGFSNINLAILKKELEFKLVTIFEVVTFVIYFSSTIIMVYFMRDIWALIISGVISSLMHTIMSFVIIPARPKFRINYKISKEIISYGKFITGVLIVSFILNQGDNAFVGRFLGMNILGYYVMAFSLGTLPTLAISELVGRVMFPAYSKIQDNQKALQQFYLRVLKIVTLMAIPSAAGLGILAPEIIKVIYGEKWLPAVGALQILCWFGAIRAMSITIGPILTATGHPNKLLHAGTVRLLAMASLIYPFTLHQGIVGTSYAVLLAITLEVLLGLIFMVRLIKINITKILFIAINPIIGSICMSAILLILKRYIIISQICILLPVIMLGAIVYFAIYVILDYDDIKGLIANYYQPTTLNS